MHAEKQNFKEEFCVKKTIRTGRKGLAFIMCVLMMLSTLVFAAPTSASAAYTADPAPENYRVIGYVTQWHWPGTDDPMVEGDAVASDIDATKLTHINYAFGHIVNSQGSNYKTGFTGAVDVPDPDKLRALVKLKEQNPDLKVLLSVGGWGMDGFCPIVHDATLRQNFVKSCTEIMKTYGLDGIDIDYEYPGTSADRYDRLTCEHADSNFGAKEGTGYVDGDAYLELMKDFRNYSEFGWDHLLTIASGVGWDWMVSCPTGDYPNYLDFINIMCYDLYGDWTDHSEFNANLYPTSTNNLSYDVVCNRLVYRGYPRDIMNIGIPIYGRDRKYRASTATPGTTGLGDDSWLTYDQIADLLDQGLTRTLDSEAKASIASGTVNGRTYEITYDDVEDIKLKTDWIQDNGFGGGMFWEYWQDTAHDSVLTKAIWDGLNGSGRKKNPPTPSPYYINNTSYPTWKSNKTKDEQKTGNVFYNGKVYQRNSEEWGYHYEYGWLPCFAPEYALDTTYYNKYVSENCKNPGTSVPTAGEWVLVEDISSTTAFARGEAKKTPGSVDSTALQIDSAVPSTQYALPGSTVTWDINVKGGSGSYSSITNQVWFLGQKYGESPWTGNPDGYSKYEKRKTGGPYPNPSEDKYVGETRNAVSCTNASTTAASHTVSATFPEEGEYLILTQVTDSTGKMAAMYSQTVMITTDMPAITASVALDKSGTILTGTEVTATVTTTSDSPVTSYKYEVYNGKTVVSTETTTSATYKFTPATAGTYKVVVTASNASGSASATSPSVNVFQPLAITSLTTTGSVTTGKAATFTCTAEGGAGGNQYSYYLVKGGKVYASVAYTSSTTFTFTVSEAGAYTLCAYCQDITGTRVSKRVTVNVA